MTAELTTERARGQQTMFDTEPSPTGLARHTDLPTAHAAARRQRGSAEQAILDLYDNNPIPRTDDEIVAAIPTLHGPTIKTARSRLTRRRILTPTSQTRLSRRGHPQIVWSYNPPESR